MGNGLLKRLLSIAISVALACALVPGAAFADVRRTDVIAGETVADRGLSSSLCPSVDADYVYVVDEDGTVYFERSATEPIQIASITKVMTAIVALDSVPTSTTVTVSEYAAAIGESTANLQAGDTLTMDQALRAMLIPSGNDAAQAVAEAVGAQMLRANGEDASDSDACAQAFVDAMNEKASELGLIDTVFRNPHGLDDEDFAGDQHSCAKDVATMCAYAMEKQLFREIVASESAEVALTRDGETMTVEVDSTDELIGVYEGVCGIKTGFTQLAGGSLASVCNRDGEYLYAIVIHASDEAQRFTDVTTLYDWVYDNKVEYRLANSSEYTIDGRNGESVPVVAEVAHGAWTDKTIKATLEDPDATIDVFALSGNISAEASYDAIDGDVHAGDVVGTVYFKQRNQTIAECKLVATEDVAAPNIIESIGIWWQRTFEGASQAQSVLLNETPLLNDKSSSAS